MFSSLNIHNLLHVGTQKEINYNSVLTYQTILNIFFFATRLKFIYNQYQIDKEEQKQLNRTKLPPSNTMKGTRNIRKQEKFLKSQEQANTTHFISYQYNQWHQAFQNLEGTVQKMKSKHFSLFTQTLKTTER